jgi:hypothetical protein
MTYKGFSNHIEFMQAYPHIEDIEVLVAEKGTIGQGSGLSTKKYHMEDLIGFVPCSHPTCHNGGLNLAKIIHEMAAKKQDHFTGVRMCTGELLGHQHCPNEFHVMVKIKYTE